MQILLSQTYKNSLRRRSILENIQFLTIDNWFLKFLPGVKVIEDSGHSTTSPRPCPPRISYLERSCRHTVGRKFFRVERMDRPAQLVYEGSRTLLEFDVTIEIAIIHIFKFGLFEVTARDQHTQCELRPVYLRSCIIEQRISPADVDLRIVSSRSKLHPEKAVPEDELFDEAVRASIFDYIADRLSLKTKMASFSGFYFELFYSPACFDLEFGPDKRHLDQLVCSDPYYFGPPPPYKEIAAETTCSKREDNSAQQQKPTFAPAKISSVLRRLSSFFAPLSSSQSDRSLQTESASTVCGSFSQASAEQRPDDCSMHSGAYSWSSKTVESDAVGGRTLCTSKPAAQQDNSNRILNRLKRLPDISESPPDGDLFLSGAHLSMHANLCPVQRLNGHKAVTPDQLAAYFRSGGSVLDEGSSAAVPTDEHHPDGGCSLHSVDPCRLSPPKCISSTIECSNDSPHAGPEFYDDTAFGEIHPKPQAVDTSEFRACIASLNGGHATREDAAAQVLGGALHRSARVGIA